jgi:heme exporter protein A
VNRQHFPALTLQAQNLGCDRGGHPVFRDVSFSLSSGEALILRGDNGAGKTSLLRLIAGLAPQCEGRVQLRFEAAGQTETSAAGHIAWQGHEDAHKRALTVLENLHFWAKIHHSNADMEAILEQVGMKALREMQAGQLSAGQKRRLALARLLVQNLPLWLLDEPTAALDTHAAAMAEGLVAAHLEMGGMAIIATHSAFAPKGKVSELQLVSAS